MGFKKKKFQKRLLYAADPGPKRFLEPWKGVNYPCLCMCVSQMSASALLEDSESLFADMVTRLEKTKVEVSCENFKESLGYGYKQGQGFKLGFQIRVRVSNKALRFKVGFQISF